MKNTFTGILSKSDRAIEAENNGMLKFSELKAWQKRAVEAGAVKYREWHHTGAAANRTYYYDPEDFKELKPEDFPLEKVEKVEQADLKRLEIEIVYNKMVGGFSRGARKKFEEITIRDTPDVRKSDGRITGVGGRKIRSNNLAVRYYYKPFKCKKWRKITMKQAIELGYEFY